MSNEKPGAEQGRETLQAIAQEIVANLGSCDASSDLGFKVIWATLDRHFGTGPKQAEQAYHARGAGREELKSCPKCGGDITREGGHGPWCRDERCKWGWEMEMDGSALREAVAERLPDSARAAGYVDVCEPGADTGTTPRRDQFIFDKDAGGNSVFTRLEAEVAFNRDKPEHEMATDTSLSQGDLRKILKAFRRQGDFTDALRGTTPPTEGQMKRTAEQVVSEWRSTGSTDWGQLVSAINYWAITDMCPALRGTTPPEGLEPHVHTSKCYGKVPETEGKGEYLRCGKVAGADYRAELLAIDGIIPRKDGDLRSVYARVLDAIPGADGPQSTVMAATQRAPVEHK